MNSIKVFLFTIEIFIFLVTSTSAESVSSRKCIEYQRTCSESTPFSLDGEYALPKEFPYMASIGYKLYKKGLENPINMQSENELKIHWLCSGSLISESFVLTMASCLSRDPYKPKHIRLGNVNIVEGNNQTHQFEIMQTLSHPSYRKQFLYDDIGLIRINGNVEFTDYIRPACLANPQTKIDDRVLVTGWGSTILQGASEPNLQKIPLNLISYNKCHNINSIEYINQALYLGIVDEKQICVGTEAGQRDLCAGFAGAPLVNTIERTSCTHKLIGLRSIRAACASGNPSVFIRVSAYLNWIEDIVWLSGNGTSAVSTATEKPIVSPLAHRLFVKKCTQYHNTMHPNCSSSIADRIFDGTEALGKEFPHMAHIGYDSESKIVWLCGGTLISERFVLTAAHCLISHGRRAKYVLLGELDHSTINDDARPTLFNIDEHIKHPEYSTKFKYHDIALFRLQTEVIFNDYMWPACLPEYRDIGTVAIATGWGLTESLSESPYLLKVDLSLIIHGNCSAIYHDRRIPKGIVDETQFCAGVNNNREDTCEGDSGGPLQILHYNLTCMYSIIGITSFGYRSCGTGAPAVYTRVYPYLDWIERVVWFNRSNNN